MNRPPDRAPGRPAGTGGSSAGARGAILLAVAAVLGIVLLQAFDSGVRGPSIPVETGTTTIPPAGNGTTETTEATSLPAVTTTVASRSPSEVKVLVANGTAIRGLAGDNSETLGNLGYDTLQPVDATRALDVTTVQHAEGYEPEARAIALALGLPATAVQPLNSPPVPDVAGAHVVVLLGADQSRDTTTTLAE